MATSPPPIKPEVESTKKLSYYEILQVDPRAHPTVIRYAYRFLAATYHPDNAETANDEMFKVITEAWATLNDRNKRNAYDIQLALLSKQTTDTVTNPVANLNVPDAKPSLSWAEVELRLGVLQVLLAARRKKPQTGGASPKMLMDCLGVDLHEMEYVLWYLREKGYINRTESQFMITIHGVDYLIEQLSHTQPLNSGSSNS